MGKSVHVPHFNRDTVEFASREREGSKPGIKILLPFLKNTTEESDLENFQDLILALDACYRLHMVISISLSREKAFQQLSTAVRCRNYLHKLGIKINFHHICLWKQLFPSAKITLQMTHSEWSNLVMHTACLSPMECARASPAMPPHSGTIYQTA